MLNYLIYTAFFSGVYEVSKEYPIVNKIIIMLLWTTLVKQLCNNTVTKKSGWTKLTYGKMIIMYAIGSLILLQHKSLDRWGKFLLMLNLIVMIKPLLFPKKWDNHENKWISQKSNNIYDFVASAMLLYLCFNINSIKWKNGKLVNPSIYWIIVHNLALTHLYLSNSQMIEGHTNILFIFSLWLPLIYEKENYFTIRAIGLVLPNILKMLDEKAFMSIF